MTCEYCGMEMDNDGRNVETGTPHCDAACRDYVMAVAKQYKNRYQEARTTMAAIAAHARAINAASDARIPVLATGANASPERNEQHWYALRPKDAREIETHVHSICELCEETKT